MKRKKGGGGGGGANWMDTYGDMVTLLLCFFVLMYSMSSVDQDKWLQVVRSFNPDAVIGDGPTSGNSGPLADPVVGDELSVETNDLSEMELAQKSLDDMIEELYGMLNSYSEAQETAENISVTKGDGFVFISLNNAVFFDGDSYVLRNEGKQVLDVVGDMLGQAKEAIDEIRVLGHTAQATGDRLNDETFDRFLASNRATIVVLYLQEMDVLDPSRIVSVGYGQWRPIASNETQEGRATNRRVEILVTAKDLLADLSDSLTQYYTIAGIETAE